MEKAIIKLETLSCPSCLQKIENALQGVEGVDKESISVLFNSSKVKMTYDSKQTSIEAIEKTIEALGYPVIKSTVKAA
ncbi:MAG: heavy-metal-associated domain-containing protein [Alkalibacterium sp.]|nr:heavy-metal-associated domain-containing protein [Alkalibacterium sp.]